jgi:hypothetical protein
MQTPKGLIPNKRRRRYPVASFGPEMMAALKKGAVETVTLKFPNLKAATFFHHRIHTLRAAMREENHPDAELVARARAMKVWGAKLGKDYETDFKGEKACHVVIQPNDAQFADVMKEAGVEVPQVVVALTPAEGEALKVLENPEPPPSADPYADFKGGDA